MLDGASPPSHSKKNQQLVNFYTFIGCDDRRSSQALLLFLQMDHVVHPQTEIALPVITRVVTLLR